MNRDYSKTIIYKLGCLDPLVPEFYLGYSTFSIQHVSKVFQARLKSDYQWPVCDFVRKHGDFENWYFERLACKSCENSLEARIELRKHFNATPPALNLHLPTRTPKEYGQGEKNKKAQKIYRETHLDKIHQDQQAYYRKNKECIIMKRRAYYELNKVRLNAAIKAYRAQCKAARLEAKAVEEAAAAEAAAAPPIRS